MDAKGWGLMILLSLLWGGAYFFGGVAIRELPPLTIALARVSLAALTLLPLFWLLGHSLPRGFAAWRPFLGMGLLNNAIPFSFILSGQTQISVGLASIINALTPLFTVLVMAAFREERLGRLRIVGVILGVVGVAVLHGVGTGSGSGSGPDAGIAMAQTLGIGLCMAGALGYGFAALWGRRFLAGVAPLKSATCQLLASTLIMAVIVAVIDRPWTLAMPGTETMLAVAGLAVVGTALAYIVFFTILVHAGASNVMLVTLLIPVTAMALGNIFLGEDVRTRDIVGALIIGAGLLFIDGRLFHRLIPGHHAAKGKNRRG